MAAKKRKKRTADELAQSQREISVSEFFAKNRHLLGFDNPLKALLTTVKEGVDNALDACEDAGILPEVTVEIMRVIDMPGMGLDDRRILAGPTNEDLIRGGVGRTAPARAPTATAAPTAPAARAAVAINGQQQLTLPVGGAAAAADGAHGKAVATTASKAAASEPGVGRDGSVALDPNRVRVFQRSLFDSDPDDDPDAAEEAEAAEAIASKESVRRGKRGVAAPPQNYVVVIHDNGPGIVKEQVGKIFGKLLYGSKFHRLRQSRGQQGIGISAAGMYGQQTTGKPVRIVSRTGPRKRAHYIEVALDLQRNQPDIRVDEQIDWHCEQGTRVVIELEAKYQRGQRSVDTYLRATALANPHVTLRYLDPEGNWTLYERATETLPEEPREVKPHPYGVELGMLLQMKNVTTEQKLGGFLTNEFSRVSRKVAGEICDAVGFTTSTWMARIGPEDVERLHKALGSVKLMNPPTDCVSPIGEGLLIDSLAREYPEAFLRAVTRPPSVYRGNPFQVEVALAWGKGIGAEGPASLLRFANRVPLLYQHGACAITKSVLSAPWRNYKVDQSRGAMPSGPLVLVVHLASVWVPFTSESKEAIAHYPEILKEIRLAVMDCGRALGRHIKQQRRVSDAIKKRDYIARYLPKISEALQKILEFDDAERDRTTERLTEVLNRSRNL